MNVTLNQRLQAGESAHLEFKKDASDLAAVGAALCAFLNGKGGSILVGVSETGQICPLEDATAQARRIEEFLRARIVPSALWSVSVETAPTGEIIEITAPAGSDRPYLFSDQIYFRRGTQSARASAPEVRALLQRNAEETPRWERQPAPDLELADLDKEEIRETANSRVGTISSRFPEMTRRFVGAEEILSWLSLSQYGTLTNAARVLFDNNLAQRLPQTRVRLTRYETDKGGQFLHDVVFEGHAFDIVEKLFIYLQQNIIFEARFEDGSIKRQSAPDYSFPALREGVLNALIHRDYAPFQGGMSIGIYPNRIEIWNSGRLPEALKVQDLKQQHPSLPFNPDIAHVFYLRGYIEKLGRGTQKIVAECKALGTPAPIWKAADSGITLVFGRRTATSSRPFNIRQERVVVQLKPGEVLVPGSYYKTIKISQRQGQRDLTELERAGYLTRQGRGPATTYVRTEKK